MLSGLAKPTADVAPPTKLSRKARRALSRTELAAASPESPYALTSDQVHTPDDQDIQTPPNETANKSPYVEVIQKKMRALRKKLTKLDKYDQLPTSELNADQIQALDKKPEIVAAFKELEDAVKQIAIVEAEEAKALLAKQHAAEEQAQNRIQNALNKAQQAHASESRKTIQLFHVLNVVLPKLTLARAHIGENEYNAVFYFRALVTGVGLEPIESPADFFNQADSYLKKYLARSEDLFVDGFTYAQLADAVDALLNPPAAPKFGGDFAAEAAVPETTSFFSNDQAEEAEENVARDGDESASKAPSFGTISFFNPSEVLDVKTETTEVVMEDETTKTELIIETVTVSTSEFVEAAVVQDVPTPNDETIPATEEKATAKPATSEEAPQTGPQPRHQRGRGRGGYRGRGGRGGSGNGSGSGEQGARAGTGSQGGYRGRGRGGANQPPKSAAPPTQGQ